MPLAQTPSQSKIRNSPQIPLCFISLSRKFGLLFFLIFLLAIGITETFAESILTKVDKLDPLPFSVNWEKQFNESYLDIFFINSQKGWAVGKKGKILATQDGGTIWTTENSKTKADLHSVHFVDSKKGWVVGAKGTILAIFGGVGSIGLGIKQWLDKIEI